MTEQERIHNIDSRVSNLETKFEIHMRRQDELAADIREIRQDMKDMQNRFYTKMDNMDAKIDKLGEKLDSKIESIGNHVRNLSVAAVIGVATIALTVVFSVLTR